ncbi:MAG: SGNH/GDSL hydrolase family protein [Acidimicrobiales bacterium]
MRKRCLIVRFLAWGAGASLLATCMVGIPVLSAARPAAATQAAPSGYVALGDSYSSGQGNPPFLRGTDDPADGDFCHRSAVAYPELASARLGLALSFYACSGAAAANITIAPLEGEPPQIAQPALAGAALTTVTIGGNDAGFAPVLTACIEQALVAPFQDLAHLVSLGLLLGYESPSCADTPAFVSMVHADVAWARTPVEQAYQAIRAHVPPQGSVLAAGYPQLFPTSGLGQVCGSLLTLLTPADQKFLNSAALSLDSVLRSAAAQAGVNYVDPTSAFSGHPVCGARGAWINGIDFAVGDAGSCAVGLAFVCLVRGTLASFHPNTAGQAGYAGVFESYVSSATARTPAGFPADPAPAGGPVASGAVVAASMPNQLGSLSVSSQAQSCDESGQAGGARVVVSGAGFAPRKPVAVYLVSPGLAGHATRVATLRADSFGSVDSAVTLPASAPGFGGLGPGPGLAFLNAVGPGSQASRVDDLAMIGLEAQPGACGPSGLGGLFGSSGGLFGSSGLGGLLRSLKTS